MQEKSVWCSPPAWMPSPCSCIVPGPGKGCPGKDWSVTMEDNQWPVPHLSCGLDLLVQVVFGERGWGISAVDERGRLALHHEGAYAKLPNC